MNNLKTIPYQIIPLPQCLEGAAFNIYNDKIFIAFGFCGGFAGWGDRVPPKLRENTNKWVSYKRGFYNDLFIYDLSKNKWTKQSIKLPIEPRQNANSIILNEHLIILGGYSYQALTEKELEYFNKNNLKLPSKNKIFTKNDGLLINLNKNFFLDPSKNIKKIYMQEPLTDYNIIKDESNNDIYILNGATYETTAFKVLEKFNIIKYNVDNSFNLIKDINFSSERFPGTLRFASNCFFKDGNIYILGGCTTSKNENNFKGYIETELCNVLDNWKYNIIKKKWTRLRDIPIPICYNKGDLYKNKYYIFIGGVTYKKTKIMNKESYSVCYFSQEQICKFPFNGISTLKDKNWRLYKDEEMFNSQHSNMIIIYDIQNDKFMISDFVLPINMSAGPVSIYKDYLYIGGAEAGVNIIGSVPSIEEVIAHKLQRQKKEYIELKLKENDRRIRAITDSYTFSKSTHPLMSQRKQAALRKKKLSFITKCVSKASSERRRLTNKLQEVITEPLFGGKKFYGIQLGCIIKIKISDFL